MSELGIIAEHSGPVEVLVQVGDVSPVMWQLHVPVGKETENSILIQVPGVEPELQIREVPGLALWGKGQLTINHL